MDLSHPPQEPHTLPLFPLGTVVFPGALLPLQIFETRYLQMVRECERTGSHFGVVTLTRGSEVHQPGRNAERFEALGTRMRIDKVQSPRPGLLHILCRALDRFEVLHTHQRSDGLWTAQVRPLPPEPAIAVPEHLRYLSRQMSEALRKLSAQALDPEPWPQPWHPEDCDWLSCRWGELLPLPTAMKYQLFALREPLLRLEIVGDMVSPETPSAAESTPSGHTPQPSGSATPPASPPAARPASPPTPPDTPLQTPPQTPPQVPPQAPPQGV